jgi:uncharacterized protein
MRRDELRQPLRKRKLSERLWAKRPSAFVLACLTITSTFIGGAAWAIRTPMPFAGEPIIVAAIPPLEELKTASVAPPEEVVEEVEAPPPQQETVEVAEPIAQDTYKNDAAIIVSPRQSLKAAPVAAITEMAGIGQLPKVSGGKRAADIYARVTPMGILHSDAPKIAILLGGMGLNAKLTAKAIKDLPGDVTLAFAPYGNDLQDQVNKARANGHEVLLQVPMEPVGYPANNPGPKTLVVEADKATNMESLHWHMSRFTGYTGIVNYMGGRFLSTPEALHPLLTEVKKRGLIFLEDGAIPLTATVTTAKVTNAPLRRANVVIDSDPTAQSITAALDLLETEARTNGFAIGTGTGLAITIETLSEWAKLAADRGVILVPISATFKGRST